MQRERKALVRRTMSGTLALLLTVVSVFSAFGTVPAAAAESKVDLSYKKNAVEDVGIYIHSETESFSAGEEVLLNIYIQNNSDQPLYNGRIKWTDRNGRLVESRFILDSEYDMSGLSEEALGFREESGTDATPGFAERFWNGSFTDKEDEESCAGPYIDEDGYICNIDLAPGGIFKAQFEGTIDEDIYGIRHGSIRFSFGAENSHGHRWLWNTEFQFNIGLMTILPVEHVDGNQVETNEEHTMRIHLGLDDPEYIFSDIRTPSVADASPSDAEKATPSVAAGAGPRAFEAAPFKHQEGSFEPEDVKYTIETYGVELKGVKASFDAETSGPAGITTEVSCRVASQTVPGQYFGTVTAEVRHNGRRYTAVQGFMMNVTGEGKMALSNKLGSAEITVSGEPSSFGEDDNAIYSVLTSELSAEENEAVLENVKTKAEELGIQVKRAKAMDLKLTADGEATQLKGPVSVTFSNLELEAIKDNGDEQEEAENHLLTSESVQVWHWNEGSNEMEVMKSHVDKDGNVVMETEHFSIFIVVDTGIVGKDVEVIVQHWGKVATIAPWKVDGQMSVSYVEGKTNEAATNPFRIIKGKTGVFYTYDEVFKRGQEPKIQAARYEGEIYTTDEGDKSITIPNGLENLSVEELSKICLASANKDIDNKNYVIESVQVITTDIEDNKTKDSSEWRYDPEKEKDNQEGVFKPGDGKTINLKGAVNESDPDGPNQALIRINYAEQEAEDPVMQDVTFWDYNIGTPTYKDGKVTDRDWKGDAEGINSNFSANDTRPKMAMGQYASGNHSSWNPSDCRTADDEASDGRSSIVDGVYLEGVGYLNQCGGYIDGDKDGNHKTARSIDYITKEDINGNRIVSFNTGFEVRKGLVTDMANGKIQFNPELQQPGFFEEGTPGTEMVTGWKLGFKQKGDTYILELVNNGSKNVGTGYDTVNYRKVGGKELYSNEFWPLDSLNYTGMDARTLPSDDGDEHNWHFGMRYDFQFKIGDYTGPMNYYFRGDDDFWLFIDDKLALEIGGIHSAVGAAIDVKQWLKENKMYDTNHTYNASIFYMERGGYGSCCYMQYTLPNFQPVDMPTVPSVDVSVNKQWKDGNSPSRPDEIKVELYRKVVGTDDSTALKVGEVTLNQANDWKHTWPSKPKINVNDPKKEYTYFVREVQVPGYAAPIVTGSLESGYTITNILLSEVSVEKQWSDNSKKEESIQVGLYVGKDRVSGTEILKLSEANQWKDSWTDLPKYNSDGQEIQYRPYEVQKIGDGYERMERGDTTVHTDADGDDGKWIVAYNEDHSVITNTYNYTSVKVVKDWQGDEGYWQETRPERVTVVLLRNDEEYSNDPKDPSGKYQVLSAENDWTATWDNLPKKQKGGAEDYEYTVRELSYSEAGKEGHQAQPGETVVFSDQADKMYEYKVTYENPDNDNNWKIINTLVPTYIQLEKYVYGADTEGNKIQGEPIHNNYKFLIQLNELSDEADDTGTLYTSALLGHGDKSGVIKLVVPRGGTWFMVDEVEPMEYTKERIADITGITEVTLADGKLLVKPGRTADAPYKVKVENRPEHSDYFHHTAAVTNRAAGTEDGFGDFKQENPFSENGGAIPAAAQLFRAVIPEQKDKRDDETQV